MQGFDYFIGQVDQGLCHNMYPRAYDEGNATRNLPLPLNDKIPNVTGGSGGGFQAARNATMANPSAFNYTVDITHSHTMAWVANEGGRSNPPLSNRESAREH